MAEEIFDPYLIWLGIPPKDQPPNHYRLLAVELFESLPAVIENAADQRMAYLRSLQVGKHGPLSQQLLNELATAKRCLLNPEQKAEYDRALRTKISAAAKPRASVAVASTAQPLPVARPRPATAIASVRPAAADPMAGLGIDFSRPQASRKHSPGRSQLPLVAGGICAALLLALVCGYAAFGPASSPPPDSQLAANIPKQPSPPADNSPDRSPITGSQPYVAASAASDDAAVPVDGLAEDAPAIENASPGAEDPDPPAVEPASPLLPELQPLTDQLNSFGEWIPKAGQWSSDDGAISGEGESMLDFRHPLPADFELQFEMNVVRGLRPRIHLGGTDIYFGNEGFERNLWSHGPGGQELAGEPFKYDNNQWLTCLFRFQPQTFEILVNDKKVVSGKRQLHGPVMLALQAGDGWSPGATQWRNFRIAAPGAENDSSPDADGLPPRDRPALPPQSARAAALREVRRVFADDFRTAKTPATKTALAAKLLQLGLDTIDNPASRYVLLEQARLMAAGAGDKPLAQKATDALAASFGLDQAKPPADAPAATTSWQRMFNDCVLLLSFDKNTLVQRDGKENFADLSLAQRQGVVEGQIGIDKGRAPPGLTLGGGSLEFNAPLLSSFTSYTVAMWCFKPDDHASLTLYSEHVGDGNLCGLLEIKEDASVKLSAWNWDGRQSWVHAATPAGAVPLNQWNFLALSLSGGGFERGTLTVQINKQTIELPSQQISAGVSFRLGGGGTGAIDEVVAFRRALTPAELSEVYNWGLKRKPLSQAMAKKTK